MIRDPWAWLRTMPSTNTRIASTTVMALGTAARVVATGWTPPDSWLLFMLIWAGVDVAQFVAKRVTHRADAATEGTS